MLLKLLIKCQKRTDRFFHLIKFFDQVKSLKKFDQLIMKVSINWKNTILIKWISVKRPPIKKLTSVVFFYSTLHQRLKWNSLTRFLLISLPSQTKAKIEIFLSKVTETTWYLKANLFQNQKTLKGNLDSAYWAQATLIQIKFERKYLILIFKIPVLSSNVFDHSVFPKIRNFK